jgi:hypothetical protein
MPAAPCVFGSTSHCVEIEGAMQKVMAAIKQDARQ